MRYTIPSLRSLYSPDPGSKLPDEQRVIERTYFAQKNTITHSNTQKYNSNLLSEIKTHLLILICFNIVAQNVCLLSRGSRIKNQRRESPTTGVFKRQATDKRCLLLIRSQIIPVSGPISNLFVTAMSTQIVNACGIIRWRTSLKTAGWQFMGRVPSLPAILTHKLMRISSCKWK